MAAKTIRFANVEEGGGVVAHGEPCQHVVCDSEITGSV